LGKMDKMQIFIISGLSGAGKSRAANILEDFGYYCVDNLPVALLPKFVEFCISMQGKYERVALVTDIRSGDSFTPLFEALDTIGNMGCESRIIFLEADVDAIIRRYKESRRRHPLAEDGESIEHVILRETEKLTPVRERADFVINTTGLSVNDLKQMLSECIFGVERVHSMVISVMSFGFKYGIPVEADLIFDVRFLPNPFYVEHLRDLTGLDKAVRDYVFQFEQTTEFLEKLYPLLMFLLPGYIEEGKSSLTIGIGCTGGKHRSTALAEEIAAYLEKQGFHVVTSHRDIQK
jgi:UPF0042 nucleotide-binding protein